VVGLAPGAARANTQHPPGPARGPANPNGRFAGKVVLITGATSGIGKATAYAMAREGARVFFCGRRVALGQRNEREIRDFGGAATFMRADVRREQEVAAFVDACVRRYGRVDIAFNNAGVETPRPAPLHEQSLETFQDVWRTNAAGVFLAMKYELPHMLRQRHGIIINTASISSEVGFATIAPYNASKHAVASLTKVAALEYADRNIRVNALAPGAVDTPMLERAAAGFGVTYEQIAQDYPIKRIVHPDEIARVVMWLASDEATPIVGTDIDASGGYLTG
jgi:NAD(P)-dependent dehydrogenase (short-subunit alcohol dehydrogenase family)